ncbi:MAG TPA: hypothetical protein VIQ05_01395 [Tardiphaga sp.]
MNRLFLFVSIVAATFIVGVWAARGFPTHSLFRPPVAQLQPTLDATFGNDQSEERRERRAQQALADPDNAKRNPLRMDALQAATGYALSPCDAGMKANLVAATRAYAAGYGEFAKCNPMFSNCDPVLEKANVMYGSPLDLRVRDALHAAFEKGGISKQDFPPNMQMSVMVLANSQGDPVSACARPADRPLR